MVKDFLFGTKRFVLNHWVGMVIAVFVGIVVGAPPVIFHFSKDYQGLEMLKTNTESHYVAQVQEIYDGDYLLHNPFFADLKDTPYLFPPLSPNIVALFGKIFFLNAVQAVIVFRFVVVSFLAFFIYYFTFLISRSKRSSWVSAPFVILGYTLLDPHNFLELLGWGKGVTEGTFIDYGRPVNPQVSSLFYFGYLIFFWKFLFENRNVKLYGIISALILGLSFYVYLFTWTFIFSLNGFLLLIFLFKKDFIKCKKIIFVSLIATVMSIPYFINTFIASQHPWYEESAVRFGFVHSRIPNFSRVIFAGIFLFLFAYKSFIKEVRLFFMAFFLTAVFVVNEQLITGLYVFNHHYNWYYNTPLIIIFIVIFFYIYLEKKFINKNIFINIVTLFLLILFFYNGIFTQYLSYKFVLPQLVDEQRYSPVFDWLNRNTGKESTVLASYPLMRMIPAVTHNNVYYHGTGIYTLISDERLSHAYLLELYLSGISAIDIDNYLIEHQSDITGYVFGYRYAFQKNVCSSCVPLETLELLGDKYKKIREDNFLDFVKKYPVDYMVWDKKTDPNWDLDRFGLEKIQTFEDISVYRID